MKTFLSGSLIGAMGLGVAMVTLVPGQSAQAQGVKTVVAKKGGQNCPSGWQNTPDGKSCKPNNSSSPAIYHLPKSGICAEGYDKDGPRGWCVEDRFYKSRKQSSSRSSSSSSSSSAGSAGLPRSAGLVLAKDNPQQLCPSGYRTSQDAKYCITLHEAAPATRARPASGCADNEVDEWGVWCTSRDTTLRYQQLENITISDFNYIYNALKKRPVPERDKYITPLMLAMGPPAPAPQAAASGSAPAASQTAAATTATAEAKPEKCKDGKGAAAGRALGGLMGGLGKKRSAAAAAEAAGALADCID